MFNYPVIFVHRTAGLLCVFMVISIKVKESGFLEVRIHVQMLTFVVEFITFLLQNFEVERVPF